MRMARSAASLKQVSLKQIRQRKPALLAPVSAI